jgi:hypothetical protein
MQTKSRDDLLGFLCLSAFHMIHPEGTLLYPMMTWKVDEALSR